VRFNRFLAIGALCLAGCGTSSSQSEGDLPAPTIPPSIADTTTSTVGFSNIAIDIFPFQNSDLAIGDCYDMGDFAQSIDCSELHDGQVISTNTLLDSSLLSSSDEDLWFEAIDESCIDYFESFTNVTYAYGDGPYVIDAIIKSTSPLMIHCTVISSDGEKWTGSAEIVVGSYDSVAFGDCFDPPTETEDAIVIPCSKPHYAEMFLVDAKIGLNDIYDPYPTEKEWDDIRDRICPSPFKKYTGKNIDDVDYSMAIIFPLESDWEDIASRTISCAITSGTGKNLVGSKRK
jgi:hypothetical protein